MEANRTVDVPAEPRGEAHRLLRPNGTSLRGTLDWWYRPMIEPDTWAAAGYLVVGALWAPLLCGLVVAAIAVTFSLFFAVVGVLLIVPAFAAIDAVVSIERRRAGWIGGVVEARPFDDRRVSGPRWWRPTASRMIDRVRWRQVAFSIAFVPVTLMLLALGSVLWFVMIGLAFGEGVDPRSIDLFGLLGAVVLAGVATRAMVSSAHLERSFVEWCLGPDREHQLRERVDELSTQRQEILEAVAGERRRIERNLHDGVQQQLVALGIDIGRAAARIDTDPAGARELLDAASDKVRGSIGELRSIGRGLHPAVLDDRGLDAALSAVVSNSTIPIDLHVELAYPLPDDLAETAYYVVNEAVANAMKHSRARAGSVRVESDRMGVGVAAQLMIRVSDDGRGGADVTSGSGLAGMRARVQGSDGTLTITSPIGGPTTLLAVIPIRPAP